ncbi:vesicle-associated membrane protein/synaptobrevin-binding protein [Uranotaenia lowii]|uniref:vesicle-associated membrane protein/synaptobrevin-binding protein n=1 Tax=Uranotaenia lowii TaxID=190385 RepID=UPI00247AF8BB|nr:vesicle-associated membrane protein/synaptobrevin-binding protein [Uranotaenia lowii]XP_055607117.1 vesicle-associated membrane protein/synaptobrevin-binding protein [Uranotaenia lowii]
MTTNKPAQLLIIEPAYELKFVGPFCTAVSSYMRLTNPTEHIIMFKIKTTAPKKYCVRPNWGVLEPKDTIEIAIILQPFNFDATEKNKHKFMVQSMILPPGREEGTEQLWKDASPDDLMDSKLRCVFEMPMDSNQPAAVTATAAATVTSQQPTNATPNKNESGVSAMESQHGSSASNEDDSGLIAEVKKLQEVERALRQENLALKEKMFKMRLDLESKEQAQTSLGSLGGSGSPSSAAAAAHYTNPYSPPALANPQQVPFIYVAASIVMAIFGLILGKFVL